ncbi:MAG: outer membrane protein OmpA-like peptidoglycan-associated protein [Cocleimonas sp.]|jgi:outer membrane protein OmpA-like peptidoglycan-associated protein
MDNNSNISPKWDGFRLIWIIVALILFIFLVITALIGYGPWGTKCDVAPTVVEKVVEKETLVDNPDLLTRIGVLEKENATIASLKQENAQIADLKTNIAGLTKSSGLVAGLQAKVKALEGVDLNFDNPVLTSRIKLLETENSSIADLKKRIIELEASNAKSIDDQTLALTKKVTELESENGLIAGLKAKVKALEAVDVNFIKSDDNTPLLQKISGLEAKNLAIPVLESRITELESKEPTLVKKIGELEKENGLIAGLKAKVAALEAVDVNFIKPKDDSALMTRIGDLEKENGLIAGLKAKVAALEAVDVNFIKPKDDSALIKRITDLEKENGLIPGLKAKVKALEGIDINFISDSSASTSSSSSMTTIPEAAKLYFEPGSSRFPTDASQSMADVIVYLRSNPSSKVSLAGFHDATGNTNWNRRLAIKRSNRVKQILVEAGISNDRINVEIPTQTLGTGSPEQARRVEVQISN